ncbi:MAG: hypothetical protein FJ217_11960 [Ignavibacteria bacterium]|nr:hypothetical protein [Ignavibacteria bacterium]
MKTKAYITSFVVVFAVSFVVSVVVSYLYALLVHGSGAADWETSLRLSITLGIIFAWLTGRGVDSKEQKS